ncbi:MAG: M50 family metallopeptidase [Candidatus Roizmanbacteria bacterium]
MSIIIFIVILALLILIHEFGHFIAAKKIGVLVEEFGFGFPPKLFGKKIGETEYTINLLPIGGFVKLFGEEYNEASKKKISPEIKKRAFVSKKPWQKTIVIIAGVVMNLVLGVGIYYFLLATNNFKSEPMPVFTDYKFAFGNKESQVIISRIVKDSPAEKSGVKPGDIITRISNTQPQENWINVWSSSQLITLINKSEGKNVKIEVKNIQDNSMKYVTVVPKYNKELNRAVIGIGLAEIIVLSYDTFTQRLFAGFLHAYNVVGYNFDGMGFLFKSSFAQKSFEPVSQSMAGFIGIFNIVDEILKSSGQKVFINLLNLIAILSLSLATINILPFPALDGGRLVFVIWEWITKKQVNPKFEQYLNVFGFVSLLALSALIFINDIIKLQH